MFCSDPDPIVLFVSGFGCFVKIRIRVFCSDSHPGFFRVKSGALCTNYVYKCDECNLAMNPLSFGIGKRSFFSYSDI